MLNSRDATSFTVKGTINYPFMNSISKAEIVPLDLIAVGDAFELKIVTITCFPQLLKHRRQLFKVTSNYVQSMEYNEMTGSKSRQPELLAHWNYFETGDSKDAKYKINSDYSQITHPQGDLFLYFDPIWPLPSPPDDPVPPNVVKEWKDPDNYMEMFVHMMIRKRRKVDMDFVKV